MAKCSFCGLKVPSGRGKTFVKTDGSIFHFDTPKCERNFRLGRESVNVKWISKKKSK